MIDTYNDNPLPKNLIKAFVLIPILFFNYLVGQKIELTGFERFGGSGSDRITAMIIDSQGNLFITGSTKSQNIATPGAFQESYGGGGITGGDAFVAKISGETLEPIWVTFLGGDNSENGTEKSGGLALTSNGSVIVVGTTASRNFPITADALKSSNNGQAEDIFISILSSNGDELLYSSYFGGSNGEILTSFASDSSGNIYLGGVTTSQDFPTTSNALLATNPGGFKSSFLVRISEEGKVLNYATYIGGSGEDQLKTIFTRNPTEVWLGGYTGSSDFPVSRDAFQKKMLGCGITSCDAFLLQLNTVDGTIGYSTYLGGRNGDEINDIQSPSANILYIGGETRSAEFPVTNWSIKDVNEDLRTPDGFAIKFRVDCNLFDFSTLIGGNRAGEEVSVVLPLRNEVILLGETFSRDFPVTENAYQDVKPGGRNDRDGFVSGLSSSGRKLFYSSYFGGDGFDNIKCVAKKKPRIAVALNSETFYIAGETRSTSLNSQDSGSMGLSDIYLARWLKSNPPLVVSPD